MKKYMITGTIIVVLFLAFFGVNAFLTNDPDIPLAYVEKGEFIISQNTFGSVDAEQAVTLSAPRIRGGLQITWLAPEGSMVEKGEPVIKFDASQQKAELTDNESELKIKLTALQRAKQEYTIQEKQLELDLQKSHRNYDEKKHEATRVASEAKMELELSELNFEAKLDQLNADVEKAEVEVQRARDKVDLARKELGQMTINAQIPGLVVYLEIWKGGTMGKVQEGDSPWRGQGLVNLPDLSAMKVKTSVSEVDAAKVDTGQLVIITLDALPGKEYHGKVTSKGTLARKKERGSRINVFDIDVSIEDHDEDIKPGMSASCMIIIEDLDSVISIPLEAVFEREGQTIVYMKNKKRREVTVGKRNDMNIEVLSGLEVGDQICLINPNLEESGLPGDRATEPELNKGRSSKSKLKKGRRSRSASGS